MRRLCMLSMANVHGEDIAAQAHCHYPEISGHLWDVDNNNVRQYSSCAYSFQRFLVWPPACSTQQHPTGNI